MSDNSTEEDVLAIDAAAKNAYYANFRVLPNGNYPPSWENTSEEVREWVRRQVRAIISGGKSLPESSGQAR
jgi:hypothetical protein